MIETGFLSVNPCFMNDAFGFMKMARFREGVC